MGAFIRGSNECTSTDHNGDESHWLEAVVYDGPKGRTRYCLGHALISTCPNEHCGAIVAFCFLTACGDCQPVNDKVRDVFEHIYANVP